MPPTPNIALLDRVRTYIGEHPDEHDQNAWALQTECGTTCCFAGWTCLLSGKQLDWASAEDNGLGIEAFQVDSGEYIPVLAATLLRLNRDESEALFYAAATVVDVDAAIADIKARAASLAAPQVIAEAEAITADSVPVGV